MKNITIKDFPSFQRPMEKLMDRGIQALSDAELLAILIGSGSKKKNAIELADFLLRHAFSYEQLLTACPEELQDVEGIGPTKSCRIIAGIHLGKRLAEHKAFYSMSLNNPRSVYNYFAAMYSTEDREVFTAVSFDTKNYPIQTHLISVGTLNFTVVHPREVFRPAIRVNANSIIVLHNHPSGDPEPSKADIQVTKRLQNVGQVIGIPVRDHIIIGKSSYVSLMERMLL